ncbi:lysophospholipid acyltransferase family protein [Candidatus Poribacteria bacterium]
MGKSSTIGKLLRHYIVYKLIAFFGFCVRRLPVHIALSLGEHAADVAYRLVKRRREITMSNLQLAFGGEKSHRELRTIAIQSYRNLGKSFMEFLRFPLLTRENLWQLVTIQGKENLDRAIEMNGKAVVFIPHSGNHEFMAPIYSVLLPKTAAIAFPLKNPYLNQMANKYRGVFGLEIIGKRRATRHVLEALNSGYSMGFVADQDAGREGIFVEFFGRLASCSRGPVAMAIKTGAAIVFSIDIRQPDDRHHVIISGPVELELTGDFDRDVAHNTAKLMAELENYIRQYPGQWMWQHNRWKTRPDSEWQGKRNQRRQAAMSI